MSIATKNKDSQLLAALREAVGVVQMVLFKEIRFLIAKKKPSAEASLVSCLAGAITNEAFGTQNMESRFVHFRSENLGEIEQGLLALKDDLSELRADVTDALRIQTLCDHQEGIDSSQALIRAKEYGFLIEDREIPLPSSFMIQVRVLGEKYNLIVPPAQINPQPEAGIVH